MRAPWRCDGRCSRIDPVLRRKAKSKKKEKKMILEALGAGCWLDVNQINLVMHWIPGVRIILVCAAPLFILSTVFRGFCWPGNAQASASPSIHLDYSTVDARVKPSIHCRTLAYGCAVSHQPPATSPRVKPQKSSLTSLRLPDRPRVPCNLTFSAPKRRSRTL